MNAAGHENTTSIVTSHTILQQVSRLVTALECLKPHRLHLSVCCPVENITYTTNVTKTLMRTECYLFSGILNLRSYALLILLIN